MLHDNKCIVEWYVYTHLNNETMFQRQSPLQMCSVDRHEGGKEERQNEEHKTIALWILSNDLHQTLGQQMSSAQK